MGKTVHHSIVVTSWSKEQIKGAHELAKHIFKDGVSNIVNGKFHSFLIALDGSNEGWEKSNEMDVKRNKFTSIIQSYKYINYSVVMHDTDVDKCHVVAFN